MRQAALLNLLSRKIVVGGVLTALLSAGCVPEPSARREDSGAVLGDLPAAGEVNSLASSEAESHWSGSAACLECHREIGNAYLQHPMANSLKLVHEDDPVEDYMDASFTSVAGVKYSAIRSGHELIHSEQRLLENGTAVYEQEFAMDVVTGSGAHGRSWLRNADGCLYQSPITWYAGDDSWALSPGYDPVFHDRFERRVTHACLSCHAGRSLPANDEVDRFETPLFAETMIGCERCHGPGEEHVALHSNEGDSVAVRDPIINPGVFQDSRLDAVCNQCHLAGQRRVLRDGHSEFDFRPGMQLSDIWTIFVKTKGVREGAAGAVSHVEQMHVSKCYMESEGALSCISCHDPHQVPPAAQRTEWYRNRCMDCHTGDDQGCRERMAERQAVSDSCIDCHMPQYPAADVHSAQTDHRVLARRVNAVPEKNSGLVLTKPELILFEEPGTDSDPDVIERAEGIYLSEVAYLGGHTPSARIAIEKLERALDRNAADEEVLLSMGRSLIQTGKVQRAADFLEQLLELNPRQEYALEILSSALHQSGQMRRARVAYEKLLQVNPSRSRYWGRFAHVLGQLGDDSAGIDAAKRALELDQSLLQAHEWLAEIYGERGDIARADFHQRQAELLRSTSSQN